MTEKEISAGEFEKDSLEVFEQLLQGYNRAKETAVWESNKESLIDKLTHLPTAPFPKELMELFDYDYLVKSYSLNSIIEKSLVLREQMQHTQRYVTIKERYYSIPFIPQNTHLKRLEVFNSEGELCYRQVGQLRIHFRHLLKWLNPKNKKLQFQDLFSFTEKTSKLKNLEIYYYSPFVDLSSTNPLDYYKFFSDYYGKIQFTQYLETNKSSAPSQTDEQYYLSQRVKKIIDLTSVQQVLWAYFLFRHMGLKLWTNLDASTLTKFILLIKKEDISKYKKSYYYTLTTKAPYVMSDEKLLGELELVKTLFIEADLPTDDIEKVIVEIISR